MHAVPRVPQRQDVYAAKVMREEGGAREQVRLEGIGREKQRLYAVLACSATSTSRHFETAASESREPRRQSDGMVIEAPPVRQDETAVTAQM